MSSRRRGMRVYRLTVSPLARHACIPLNSPRLRGIRVYRLNESSLERYAAMVATRQGDMNELNFTISFF